MEDENITTEVPEEDYAGFDDGWDDETALPAEEPAEDEAGAEAEEATESAGGDQTGSTVTGDAEPQSAEEAAPAAEGEGGNQTFTLKHLGTEKTVGREEVTALAQKGLDYDRQVQEHNDFLRQVDELGGMNALRDYKAFVEEIAAGANTNAQELIDSTRAAMLAKRENIDVAVARERVNAQKAQKAQETAKEAPKEDDAEERRRADIQDFQTAFPEVAIKDVPQEVWAEVAKGKTLTASYTKYENARLRRELAEAQKRAETAEQNAQNRQKAAPSVQTAGAKTPKIDPFDEAWGDD